MQYTCTPQLSRGQSHEIIRLRTPFLTDEFQTKEKAEEALTIICLRLLSFSGLFGGGVRLAVRFLVVGLRLFAATRTSQRSPCPFKIIHVSIKASVG
jgi:hypothetical protein